MASDTGVKRHRKRPLARKPLTLLMPIEIMASVGKKQEARRDAEMRKQTSPYAFADMKTRLSWARVHAGLGCNDLDKLAGFKGQRASGVETGKRKDPTMETMRAFAEVLKVTLDWLANGSAPAYVKDLRPRHPNLELTLVRLNEHHRWREETVNAARCLKADMEVARWPTALNNLQATVDSFRAE